MTSRWNGEMDYLVKFNKETSSRRVYYGSEDCIAFGDVRSSLCYIDEDLVRQWDEMISGMNEKFLEGAGI